MSTLNILLAGFGGQGILFTGKVLAYCGLMAGKELSWLPSYGPEMRGGTANCSVCISDEPIASPLVLNPQVLIAMNVQSYDKFIDAVAPGGIAILDSTLIDKKCSRTDIKVCYVPATQMASDHDLTGLANMIVLGKLLAEVPDIADQETLDKALQKCIPPKKQNLYASNLKAIQMGMQS